METCQSVMPLETHVYYEVLHNHLVQKVHYNPTTTLHQVCAIGHYLWFESEGQWVFVNTPVRSLPDRITYCAHRSHTPSYNFDEVVHREVVREQWNMLLLKLAQLQQERFSELVCSSTEVHQHIYHRSSRAAEKRLWPYPDMQQLPMDTGASSSSLTYASAYHKRQILKTLNGSNSWLR